MKIRSCFVANSSSSSFIIAYKSMPKLKIDGLPKWAKSLIKKSMGSITKSDDNFYEESSRIVTNKTELDEYFSDQYLYKETLAEMFEKDPGCKEDYDEYISILEKGYSICFREVDYNNKWLSDFFEELPDEDDGTGMFVIKSYS